jgi:hypothetical protein
LKIAVQAPPVEGRANEALIAFLAETFGIPKRSVELVSGESSRSKVFLLRGVRGTSGANGTGIPGLRFETRGTHNLGEPPKQAGTSLGFTSSFGEEIAGERVQFDAPVLEFFYFNDPSWYPRDDPIAGCFELVGTYGIDGRS